jgi:uncharacterized membrane protein YccC
LAPVTGLITAIPVVVVFGVGLALHNPRAAITMAVGANLVAVVSLVGAPKLPLRLALLDAVALGMSVMLGTITGGHPWLHTALLVPWCFAAGMAVIFGQTQAVLGSQAIVAYVVLGRFSGSALTAVHLGLLVTLGAVVEVGALLVLRLPPTLRYQRAMVATALSDLAQYAAAPAETSAFGILASIDAAQRVLSPLSLLGRSDDRDLRAIVDQARRARLDFTTLAGLRARLSEFNTTLLDEVHDALVAVAQGVTQLSLAVRRPGQSNSWRDNSAQLQQLIDNLEARLAAGGFDVDVHTLMAQVLAHLDALGGQLRSIGHLVERDSSDSSHGAWRLDVRWGGLSASRWGDNFDLLRDNLRRDSTAFRHAIRLVVAVLLATALAHWLNLPRGYWVAFAVAVMLKPDYSTLLRRGVGRVVGTALGASLAAVAVSELHPSYALTTVLIGVLAAVAYMTWSASFSVAIGLVTALVLIMLSVSTTNSVGTALDRLLDVVLGAVISAATYLAWPSSPAQDVRDAESALFSALARYVDEVLKFSFGDEVDSKVVAGRSRTAHFRYATAEGAVGRSLEEPSTTRSDPQVERGLLSSGLRILRATHALRFEAERDATTTTTPALEDLRRALVAALDNLGKEEPAPVVTSPRRAFRTASADLSLHDAPASIALNLDELVNAINTASHLIAN